MAPTLVLRSNATAADPADFISLTLLDDAAGRFALNSDGQIVTASSIDFEIAESHEVTVEARTEGGLITSNTFEIQVEDDPSDEPSTIEFDFNLSGLFPEIENIIHYQLFFDQPDAFHFENKFPVAGAFWGDVGTSDWVSGKPALLVYSYEDYGINWLNPENYVEDWGYSYFEINQYWENHPNRL